MSIIRHVVDEVAVPSPLRIHLLYGSRTPDDVIFGRELAELAARHPLTGSELGLELDYSLVISEPSPYDAGEDTQEAGEPTGRPYRTGFLGPDLIREQVGEVAGKTFYVCGPGVMYDFCLEALAELGVPRHKIKRELYGPPGDVTREPGWPAGLSAEVTFEVVVEASTMAGSRTIRAPAAEPLLNSLERYGLVVPAVCRAGECSACRTRLLSGRVFQPAHTGLRESDRAHGYIHACVSYPLEDLRIRI
jgi:ferredoxin-NADP reductase